LKRDERKIRERKTGADLTSGIRYVYGKKVPEEKGECGDEREEI
jgi:hypothetical protein